MGLSRVGGNCAQAGIVITLTAIFMAGGRGLYGHTERTASAAFMVTAVASVMVVAQQSNTDWTQWRGPTRDGAATTFSAPATWPDALVQKWKVEVGEGYASPIVVGDRVYVFSRRGTNEGMSAHDAATGRELWRFGYEAPFTMNSASARHNAGPKSTPVFANGRLLSIGMTGVVTAWDAATGRTIWQKPGSEPLPHVHHACVFTDRRWRPRDFSPRRTRQGVAHSAGRRYRRDALELDRRWAELWLTNHRDHRRDQAGHHDHPDEGRRC